MRTCASISSVGSLPVQTPGYSDQHAMPVHDQHKHQMVVLDRKQQRPDDPLQLHPLTVVLPPVQQFAVRDDRCQGRTPSDCRRHRIADRGSEIAGHRHARDEDVLADLVRQRGVAQIHEDAGGAILHEEQAPVLVEVGHLRVELDWRLALGLIDRQRSNGVSPRERDGTCRAFDTCVGTSTGPVRKGGPRCSQDDCQRQQSDRGPKRQKLASEGQGARSRAAGDAGRGQARPVFHRHSPPVQAKTMPAPASACVRRTMDFSVSLPARQAQPMFRRYV